MNKKEELAKESEKLIGEMERIYFQHNWRGDPDHVKRDAEIKHRLGQIFLEAETLR